MNWNPNHPIGRLIAMRAYALGPTKNAIVAALEYRNQDKGRRVLERLLAQGELRPSWRERLLHVFQMDAAEFDDSYELTRREIREARETVERWRFHPYIFAIAEGRGVGSPTICAFSAGLLIIPLDRGIDGWPWPRQSGRVASLIRAHCARNEGEIPLFGRITGYRYPFTYYHAIRFDTAGSVIAPFDDSRQESKGALTVKGCPFPMGMLAR